MYQNNITTSQIKDKSYLQGFNIALLYPAKIKTVSNYININIATCAHALIITYNMLQKYSIDPINMILTIGLRPPERFRVKTDRTILA